MGLTLETELGLKVEPCLEDHGFKGMVVVPGSTYITLALETAARLGDGWNCLRDLAFEHVFILQQDSRTLRLVLEEDGDERLDLEAFSGEPEQEERHVKGQLVRNGRGPATGGDGDLAAARERCRDEVSGADFYRALRRNGNEYGPCFQGVRDLRVAQNEAIARITAPASIGDVDGLHPALLDACIQTLSACHDSRGRTYYLKGVDEVRVLGRLGAECWSHATAANEHAEDAHAVVGSIRVYDESGELVLVMDGVRLEYLESDEAPRQNIVVAATFTAEPLEDTLSYWGSKLGTPYAPEFAPYNQILQQLLDPESLVSRNKDGVNVLLTRLEDAVRFRQNLALQVEPSEKKRILEAATSYTLPNGLEIAHLLEYESEYVYKEIFVDDAYGKHGISLPEDACIVDVGANIGLFALRMQALCENPTIYCFEPAPAAFRCLEANTKLYCKNAHALNCGASDEDKSLPFTFYKNASVFSSYAADAERDETAVRAVVENMLRKSGNLSAEQIEAYADDLMDGRMESETVDVPLRALSNVIDEHEIRRIDLLKIDAEGAEMDVLRGIRPEHWPLVQQIVVEVHDQEGDLIRSVLALLEEQGFETVMDEEDLLHGSGLYNVYAHRGSVQAHEKEAADAQASGVEQSVQEMIAALESAASRNPSPFLVGVCPSSPDWLSVRANRDLHDRTEALLVERLSGLENVHLLTAKDLLAQYPAAADYDAQSDALGHVPYTHTAYAAIATACARRIHRFGHPPAKVIVLDCDNTLWGGVVGEDGPTGLRLDGPYAALQQCMVDQHETGTVICLATKNNEADVEEVFEQRPDMILKKEHLVGTKINWMPKSQNIQELARELNLGLDSFVFIDDNPVECAEVQASCPDVLVLQLPEAPEDVPGFLQHIWAFDHLKVTDEDRKRTALYAANMEREQSRAEAPSLKAFIESLDLKAEVGGLTKENLPRVSQLTQRTNQFNFTTVRRSETEISSACDSGELRCVTTRVSDRFGDYGLVGLQLFRTSPDALTLDTMLLSCRVLGRGVEYQMLARLGAIAVEEGVPEVHAVYVPSKKNAPALQYLDLVGGSYKDELEDRTVYRFPAETLAALTYEPADGGDETSPKTKAKAKQPKADSRQTDSRLFTEIATTLRDPARVFEEVQKHRTQERPAALGEYVVPASELERQIAAIWESILGVEQVGVHDNFFDIGGTSLKAVQVVAQMTRELGIELRAVALFEKTTVHALAEALSSSEGAAATQRDVEKSKQRGARRRAQRVARRSRTV